MNVEATARPNMPMQLTPLRGPEIGAFLTVSSGLSVFRSIGGGATDGQTVHHIILMLVCHPPYRVTNSR